MILFISFLFNLFLINESKDHLWEPTEIKNPLTNSQFCNVHFDQRSFICDPEDKLDDDLKIKVSDYLAYDILHKTPCFCDESCASFDYKHRLMVGIVVVSAINENIRNCSKDQDVNDCFSEQILRNWNISMCSGNNGLILVTTKGTHIYFGASAQKRISTICLVRLKSLIRPLIPLIYNVRTLMKQTLQYIRKPCNCNDSCSYRHLKWLTNVVFFMGVIVLVTCIGGMSRRALVSKFHDRPAIRSNIFTSSFYRPRLIGIRPIPTRDVGTLDIAAGEQHPPDYSSIGPLPKPPPYIASENTNFPKTNNPVQACTRLTRNDVNVDSVPNDETGDQPPAYALIVGDGGISSELITPVPHRNQNPNETHSNNNPAYQI